MRRRPTRVGLTTSSGPAGPSVSGSPYHGGGGSFDFREVGVWEALVVDRSERVFRCALAHEVVVHTVFVCVRTDEEVRTIVRTPRRITRITRVDRLWLAHIPTLSAPITMSLAIVTIKPGMIISTPK